MYEEFKRMSREKSLLRMALDERRNVKPGKVYGKGSMRHRRHKTDWRNVCDDRSLVWYFAFLTLI